MSPAHAYRSPAYRYFMDDSLRRNSSFLILSQAVNGAAAFLFWIICAHLFKTNEVGLAVAIVSFGGLVSTFTNLGLPNTVIRFLPTSKSPGGLFSSSIYLTAICSVVGALVSLLIIRGLVPKLGVVNTTAVLALVLVLLIVGNGLSSLLDSLLMSFRMGEYILWKALIINVPRVALPFFIVSFGLRGIISTYVIMVFVGIAYALLVVLRKPLKEMSLVPDFSEVLKHRNYSISNYFGGMFATLPASLLPIIVLQKLGAADAAYAYMPLQMALFLNYIPSSTAQALISESSQTDDTSGHKTHFTNALLHGYRILIPIGLVFLAVGWPVLRLYGPNYARNGYLLLILLTGSMVFVAINFLGDTWLNIQMRPTAYFLMNAFNAVATVGFVFALAGNGLTGIGLGWLAGQALSAAVYLVIFGRSHLLSLPFRRHGTYLRQSSTRTPPRHARQRPRAFASSPRNQGL